MGRTLRLDVLGPFQARWSDGVPVTAADYVYTLSKGHAEAFNGDTKIGDFYPAIAAMTKTPVQHIKKIKWPDMQRIMPIVTYFLAE